MAMICGLYPGLSCDRRHFDTVVKTDVGLRNILVNSDSDVHNEPVYRRCEFEEWVVELPKDINDVRFDSRWESRGSADIPSYELQ